LLTRAEINCSSLRPRREIVEVLEIIDRDYLKFPSVSCRIYYMQPYSPAFILSRSRDYKYKQMKFLKFILYPLIPVYLAVIKIRNLFFDKNIFKSKKVNANVISNISWQHNCWWFG